jgi:hypothetical protein
MVFIVVLIFSWTMLTQTDKILAAVVLATGVGFWGTWQFFAVGRKGDIIRAGRARRHTVTAAEQWPPWPLLALIGALYGLSFYLPVSRLQYINGHGESTEISFKKPLNGYDVFARTFKEGTFMWLANPALWLGCLALIMRKWHWASLAGLVATSLSLPPTLSLNGYLTWKASMVLLSAGGLYGWWRSRLQGLAGNPETTLLKTDSPEPGSSR